MCLRLPLRNLLGHSLCNVVDPTTFLPCCIIVNQNVDASEGLHNPGSNIPTVRLLLQITSNKCAMPAVLLDLCFSVLCILLLVGQVNNGDLSTLHREKNCNGAADAGVAPCDESVSAFELIRWRVDAQFFVGNA